MSCKCLSLDRLVPVLLDVEVWLSLGTGMSSDKVLPSNTRSISSDTSEVPRASLLELEVSADIFWFKHGRKNVAMLHCFLQGGSPIALRSGRAGQLEFESNRLAITSKKFPSSSKQSNHYKIQASSTAQEQKNKSPAGAACLN